MGMGVLFQTGVCVGLGLSGRAARSCGQTPLAIRIVPKSSDHPQSRFADIAQATDWLVHLRHPFLGETWSTHFAICEGGDTILS